MSAQHQPKTDISSNQDMSTHTEKTAQINDGPNTQGRKNTLQITQLNTQMSPAQKIPPGLDNAENVISTIKHVEEKLKTSDG